MTEMISLLLDSAMAIIATFLAALFWLRGTKQFRMYFVALTLLVSLLAVTYLCELFSPDLASKLFWNKIEYVSMAGVPILYLLIMVKYAGREDLLTKRNVLLVSFIPLLCLVMVWTNEFHHLFYQNTFIEPGSLQPFSAVDGLFFQLQIVYSFGLVFVAMVIAAVAFVRSPRLQRAQVGLVLLSALVPTFLVGSSLAMMVPISVIDSVLLSFVLTGILLFLAVIRYGLFYATPLVLNSIADIMKDGAIMLNLEGQVTYLNSAAEKLMNRQKGYPLGRPIEELLPAVPRRSVVEGDVSKIVEMIAPEGQLLRLEVRSSPIMVERNTVGHLLIIRDITAQTRTEEALLSSNSKLNVLYDVTRHDILNKISVIRGYGQLLMQKSKDNPQINKYLEKMVDSTIAIEHLINFTKDYERIGVISPEWQNVEKVFHKARALIADLSVEYVVNTGALEIFADPMLEHAFNILLDNTNRYGKKVTKVQLSASPSPEGYSIVYEDDGVGVNENEKEKIFLKGYGKDSGMGLYLCVQILNITGLGIKENGEYLKGARFEISVPNDKWR
jgi:PAS domain S-box-containing protein